MIFVTSPLFFVPDLFVPVKYEQIKNKIAKRVRKAAAKIVLGNQKPPKTFAMNDHMAVVEMLEPILARPQALLLPIPKRQHLTAIEIPQQAVSQPELKSE
jgi:hypothetical protein